MTILPIIIVVGLAVVIIAMVMLGLSDSAESDPLQDRLEYYGVNEVAVESLEEVELSLSFRDRVIVPIIERLGGLIARFTPQKQLEDIARQLELAADDRSPTQILVMRIVYMIILCIVSTYVVLNIWQPEGAMGPAVIAGATLLGYRMPVSSLAGKIRKRQRNIVRALPDALDLLVICVEAGLGFDQAMGKVYEKWDNELALAFGRVLREIQLGKARRDALKDMSDRMDVPDVKTFTAAIIQAEQLGVSIGNVLRIQSDQMRIKRRQRAQEKAQQAPVKMVVPMVFLIFPSVYIVLLGPAAIQIMESFGIGPFAGDPDAASFN